MNMNMNMLAGGALLPSFTTDSEDFHGEKNVISFVFMFFFSRGFCGKRACRSVREKE